MGKLLFFKKFIHSLPILKIKPDESVVIKPAALYRGIVFLSSSVDSCFRKSSIFQIYIIVIVNPVNTGNFIELIRQASELYGNR